MDYNEMLESMGYEDWYCEDALLVTPLGYTIEWDGVSPEGEVSPFVEMGMI